MAPRLGFGAALRSARDSLHRGRRSVSATIELPVWLIGILAVLALVAVLDRLLIPSVRFFLRRRFNEAIAELNSRLRLQIQPFKLTRLPTLLHPPCSPTTSSPP